MSKKIISIITTIALILTMIVPAMAGNGDGTGEDDFPSSVSIHNQYLLGEYTLGAEKIFKISTYASGSDGTIVNREVKITGDAEVSVIEFLDGDTWKDISEYNTQIALKNDVERQIRVVFDTAGVYTITFTLYDTKGAQLVQSKRVVTVSNDGIALYNEPETTTEPVTTTVAPVETTTTPQPSTIIIIETKVDRTTTTAEKITAPAKAKINKVNAKKKSAKKVKLTLKKTKGAAGYQVAIYKTKKNAQKNKKAVVKKIVGKTKVTISSKKLKNNKKLYVKARAYVLDANKKKLYGKWSNIKKVKITK